MVGEVIFANENIEAKVQQDSDGKDWIERVKEEIRSVDLSEFEDKNEIIEEDQKEINFSQKKIFDEIGTGLSEKGIYLDFIKNANKKNKFGIRVNYLPEDFFTHKEVYIDGRNIKAEYFGLGILYQHHFLSPESRSNFFLSANTDISKLRFFHDIDLSKETKTIGNSNAVAKCSSCGILTIQTDPDAVYLIPSLSFGYQYKITENFKTNISAGIQFLNLSDLESYLGEGAIPDTQRNWVQPRINNYVEKSQNKINKYSEFQPSINIGFSYAF
tara:strand:+ start:8 stop:823 length:816 start_codon:yes stop_codon:yes gene_type:complete